MPMICCIDGNIGAGKSTFLDFMSSRGYKVFKEDVESWEWCLSKYYKDPVRWSFTLQTLILNSMAKIHDDIMKESCDVVFVERSSLSTIVFAKTSLSNGMMTQDEYNLFESMVDKIGWHTDLTLLLNVSPQKCLERIKLRNRVYEQDIDMSYLVKLHDEYSLMASKHDFIVINDEDDSDELVTTIIKRIYKT